MSWPTVSSIVDNQTVLNANGLGGITAALTERTEDLNSRIGAHYDNATVISDVGFAGLVVGQVAAYNVDENCYVAAQPTSSIDGEGRILPGSTAYIAGIVFSTPDSNGVAQLLVRGVVTANKVGLNGQPPGPYYLGDDGTLVYAPTTGRLAIYCGYLTNTGWFIFNPMAPQTAYKEQTIAAPISNIISGANISVSQSGRNVMIGVKFSSGATVTSGGYAVNVSSGALVTVPVVNQLSGSNGVSVIGSNGILTVTGTSFSQYIDFQTINANNVLIGGGINDQLVTFPAGITASIVGLARLPRQLPSVVEVFVWTTSGVTGLTGSVIPIRAGIAMTPIAVSFTQSGSTNEYLSAALTSIEANDLLKVVLTASSPSSPIGLSALGVKVS